MGEIYVDGIYQCASSYVNPCTITVSAATSLVSIRVLNGGWRVGFIATIGYGGCTSNSGWKCTTTSIQNGMNCSTTIAFGHQHKVTIAMPLGVITVVIPILQMDAFG